MKTITKEKRKELKDKYKQTQFTSISIPDKNSETGYIDFEFAWVPPNSRKYEKMQVSMQRDSVNIAMINLMAGIIVYPEAEEKTELLRIFRDNNLTLNKFIEREVNPWLGSQATITTTMEKEEILNDHPEAKFTSISIPDETSDDGFTDLNFSWNPPTARQYEKMQLSMQKDSITVAMVNLIEGLMISPADKEKITILKTLRRQSLALNKFIEREVNPLFGSLATIATSNY